MRLAINGGRPVRTEPFPAYEVIGEEERRAVDQVLASGVLSRFLGCWHEDFYGGPQVRALEQAWAAHFQVRHAIAVNSATSGLYCAVGACGAGPGDEVIVSPFSMSASAVAPLIFNAVPVFCDIEADHFCLDPQQLTRKITPRTKAIIAVDLFGHPYDHEAVNAIARSHGIPVIEDAAQAPGALADGRWAGTLGDIGIFSLNYHKHIHCGEGGIVVTDDDELAERIRLIRNHAEAVVAGRPTASLVNLIGFNFRMTEIEAAIAQQQLLKLMPLVEERQRHCAYLETQLAPVTALTMPKVRAGATHSYYVHAMKWDAQAAGVHRDRFVAAVKAELAPSRGREQEGVLINGGYVAPLYRQPLFRQQIVYGDRGCPLRCPWYDGKADYRDGLCPTTEMLHEQGLIEHELIRPGMQHSDLDDVAEAFVKVWECRAELG